MDLEKEPENLLWKKEHGQCGQMGKKHKLMMVLVENNHMEYIHLCLFKQLSKENIWEFTLEILMQCLQLSVIQEIVAAHLATLQLVDKLKFILCLREGQKISLDNTRILLDYQFYLHFGHLDGMLHQILMWIKKWYNLTLMNTKKLISLLKVFGLIKIIWIKVKISQ